LKLFILVSKIIMRLYAHYIYLSIRLLFGPVMLNHHSAKYIGQWVLRAVCHYITISKGKTQWYCGFYVSVINLASFQFLLTKRHMNCTHQIRKPSASCYVEWIAWHMKYLRSYSVYFNKTEMERTQQGALHRNVMLHRDQKLIHITVS